MVIRNTIVELILSMQNDNDIRQETGKNRKHQTVTMKKEKKEETSADRRKKL